VDDDETVEVRERERMDEDGIGDAENHRVQPDADREAGDRHARDALVFQCGPEAKPNILQQCSSIKSYSARSATSGSTLMARRAGT
jgi:hypothetical protein